MPEPTYTKEQMLIALENAMLDLEVPMSQGCDILGRFELAIEKKEFERPPAE